MTQPKTRSATRVALSQMMSPADSTSAGHVHGGFIVKLIDEAGAIAAMRHAGLPVVTVVIDSVSFLEPVRVGDLLVLEAELTRVWKTSIEARVLVHAENVVKGTRTHTNAAYAVYVALDKTGKPTAVPELVAETDDDRTIMTEADERRKYRLSQRKKR